MPADGTAECQRRAKSLPMERVTLSGDAEGVSEGLATLFNRPFLARLTEDSRGTARIVLAEALNNIAEHAYASHRGAIDLQIAAHDGFLQVRLVDTGLPMPGGMLPVGKLSPHGELADLPEGGFGWYLIRSLTKDLTFRREGSNNMLSFCLDVEYQP